MRPVALDVYLLRYPPRIRRDILLIMYYDTNVRLLLFNISSLKVLLPLFFLNLFK